MSIQSQLNNDALAMLPQTFSAIKQAKQFESDQMQSLALRLICNSSPCLDDMSENQLKDFDQDLMERFGNLGYLEP